MSVMLSLFEINNNNHNNMNNNKTTTSKQQQQATKENMGKKEEERKSQESRTSSSTVSGMRVLKDSNLVLAKAQLSRSDNRQLKFKLKE